MTEQRYELTPEEAAEYIKTHCCRYYPDRIDGTKWEVAMCMAVDALKEKAERERDKAAAEHWRDRGY